MTDLHFTTISGADTVVREDIINAFKTTFRGETLFPGDEHLIGRFPRTTGSNLAPRAL